MNGNARSNIVLIGMPGAGKSTLGVVLAKRLNLSFLDGDLLIQRQQGKTLQRIIDEHGGDGFRAIESAALLGINEKNTVIATGGSAIYSPFAMEHLGSTGIIAYLEISCATLVERLGDLRERGVVPGGNAAMSLSELYEERRPLYERYADITVNVDGLSIADAVLKIADTIGPPVV